MQQWAVCHLISKQPKHRNFSRHQDMLAECHRLRPTLFQCALLKSAGMSGPGRSMLEAL